MAYVGVFLVLASLSHKTSFASFVYYLLSFMGLFASLFVYLSTSSKSGHSSEGSIAPTVFLSSSHPPLFFMSKNCAYLLLVCQFVFKLSFALTISYILQSLPTLFFFLKSSALSLSVLSTTLTFENI